jgi:glycosyltransferase involved in cell wall biosynthesis
LFGREPRRRVLFISHDVVGPKMAGPAIRTMELARVLSADFDVTVAVPEKSRDPGWGPPLVDYGRHREDDLRGAVGESDALVVQGFTLFEHPWVRDAGVPIVVDINCLFTLENFEFFLGHAVNRRDMVFAGEANLGVMKGLLRSGDFFICSTETQRDFWMGMLHGEGRLDALQYAVDPTGRNLIDTVPFGISDRPPRGPGALKGKWKGIDPDDFLLIWGGGIYEWFDPETLIRALAVVRKETERVKLFFMGVKHPNPTIPTMAVYERTRALARDLGLLDTAVFFNEWTPFDERGRYLIDADVGVSIHRDSLETRYSFRTRLLDYLWAGLPIVSTDGDYFADLIRSEEAGIAVPEGDPRALARAILDLVADPAFRRRAGANAARLRESFYWKNAILPLKNFIERPQRFEPIRFPRPEVPPSGDGKGDEALRERVAALEARYRNLDRLCLLASRIPFSRRIWRTLKKWKGWD